MIQKMSTTVTKVEFAVRMTCQACVDAVSQVLKNVEGIESYSIDLGSECVVLETSLNTRYVQHLIESTGRQAVLQGIGSKHVRDSDGSHLGAAVAMLAGPQRLSDPVLGVVRLVQLSEELCVLEGTIDGLQPGEHALRVHSLGDISQGCASCGDVFIGSTLDKKNKRVGDLGSITAEDNGRAEFRVQSDHLKVWDVIGRSIVIHHTTDDQNVAKRVGCGIIARSSGVFENTKRLCACDGVSIWDERDRPIVGPGRKQPSQQVLASL